MACPPRVLVPQRRIRWPWRQETLANPGRELPGVIFLRRARRLSGMARQRRRWPRVLPGIEPAAIRYSLVQSAKRANVEPPPTSTMPPAPRSPDASSHRRRNSRLRCKPRWPCMNRATPRSGVRRGLPANRPFADEHHWEPCSSGGPEARCTLHSRAFLSASMLPRQIAAPPSALQAAPGRRRCEPPSLFPPHYMPEKPSCRKPPVVPQSRRPHARSGHMRRMECTKNPDAVWPRKITRS